MTTKTSWLQEIITSYPTVERATIDIRYDQPNDKLTATCTACHWAHQYTVFATIDDTPEQVAARVGQMLPHVQQAAQNHAEKCRALPLPR